VTAPPNPLIAERVDTTPFYAGITLVEGIVDTKKGIEAGSWISTSIGGAFVAVDTTLLVLDPLGSMTSWLVAMCLEHIKPLADALDWLAGDPDQVAANAQTWANVAAHTMRTAHDLREAVWQEIPHWAGPAADAYRGAAEVEFVALQGYAESAAAKAAAVDMSGRVVLIVRTMVRDLIADLVSVLLVRGPMWTAETTLSLGTATPWVAGQIGTLCAKWALKIAKLLEELLSSLGQLAALVRKVDEFTSGINARPRGGGNSAGGVYPGHSGDLDLDGRPDALDPDADGNGVLDDLNGDGRADIVPRFSDKPDLPTTNLMSRYVGETDAATATSLFNVPSHGVKYLTPDEAEGFRIFVRDGKIYSARDGVLFDTSAATSLHPGGSGRAIFVMDNQGNLYASIDHSRGAFHHSSFLAGGPVAGAGEIVVENGKVILITDRSGHYQPPPQYLQQVLDQLRSQGVDVSSIQVGSW
jgi:hypothetical protein